MSLSYQITFKNQQFSVFFPLFISCSLSFPRLHPPVFSTKQIIVDTFMNNYNYNNNKAARTGSREVKIARGSSEKHETVTTMSNCGIL